MTLNTRNKILTSITIFSFVLFVIYLVGFILFVVNGKLSSIPELPRIIDYHSDNIFLGFSPMASVISVLIWPFYVALFGMYIFLVFEKTKSDETIYLTNFFIGSVLKTSSIMVVFFQLWKNSSFLLLFLGKVHFCGMMISGISLLMFAVFMGSQQMVNTDRNVLISIATSIFVACILPINVTKIFSNLWMSTGFDNLLIILQVIVFVLYIFIFIDYTKKNELKILKNPMLYGIILYVGDFFLNFSDNYFVLILSCIAFFYGTYRLLKTLHKQYLWL
ncbi:MAG: hypothetical protein ACTTHG_05320 [Treponemataceae bacterium]